VSDPDPRDDATPADRPNADEGAGPSGDVAEQNPGETTTEDLAVQSGD
jgi:hypothetical protein